MEEPAKQATEAEAGPSLPQASSPSQGVSFMTATIIAAAIAAFSAVLAVWYVQTHANVAGVPQKFVFVDGNAIFKAQVKAFAEGKDVGMPDAAEKAAKEFAVKMNAAMAPYKDAGYIVLNSSVAMNIPEGLDITKRIAKQVGVEIQ